jgi:DNA invertase Pin-like site-specific DNA recombinase
VARFRCVRSDLSHCLRVGERMIWYYGRVSTDHQENSAANQRQVFEELAAEAGEPYQIVVDEDVSAKTSLCERPQGRYVWDQLKAGDMLVVLKLDRGWRSVEDASRSLRVLREIGVRLKILDFPVDVSTDEGEFMFLTFAGFAQYENRLRGRRVKDINHYRRRNDLPYNVARPFGWKRSGHRWVELPEERAIADEAAELRAAGLSFNAIASKFCLRPGYNKPAIRPTKKPTGRKLWYCDKDIKGLLLARAAGYPRDPQSHVRASAPAKKPA